MAGTEPPGGEPTGNPAALPQDSAGRRAAHDELHARPVAPVVMPAMITQVVVEAAGHTAEEETAYLRGLAAAHGLRIGATDLGLNLTLGGAATLAWERHVDYSLYTVQQPVDIVTVTAPDEPELLPLLPLPDGWLAGIPGRTLSAVQTVILPANGQDDVRALAQAQRLLGAGRMLGSRVKDGTARVYTTYRLRPDGTSRFLVLCDDVTEGRAGRIVASLLDAERYRILALLGYPRARRLVPELDRLEARLASATRAVEDVARDDRALLDELIGLAVEAETLIAEHTGPFGAALAYFGIVEQRVEDLRGASVPGLMGLFTFLRRRLLPAMATVESAGRRMDDLSERIARTADLLRTRVEVTAEAQSQDLLRELRRGQAVQLRLQETVEGLSIVAISYYAVGLIGYAVKGVKAAGLHVDGELTTAATIPLVLAGVWLMRRAVSRRVHGAAPGPASDAAPGGRERT